MKDIRGDLGEAKSFVSVVSCISLISFISWESGEEVSPQGTLVSMWVGEGVRGMVTVVVICAFPAVNSGVQRQVTRSKNGSWISDIGHPRKKEGKGWPQ